MVLTGGIVAPWGLDKAVLALCAARICRLVLAAMVQEEVENNLLSHAAALPPHDAEQVLADYSRLLTLTHPEIVPLPDLEAVVQARPLIRHAADVPVLLSAMRSQPDWLLTHNTAHFTPAVATRTGYGLRHPARFSRPWPVAGRDQLKSLAHNSEQVIPILEDYVASSGLALGDFRKSSPRSLDGVERHPGGHDGGIPDSAGAPSRLRADVEVWEIHVEKSPYTKIDPAGEFPRPAYPRWRQL